jgi:hypothetical protein
MIRLEVEPYCQECQDFEADVERPECNLFLAPILMGKRSNSSHAAIRSFDDSICILYEEDSNYD